VRKTSAGIGAICGRIISGRKNSPQTAHKKRDIIVSVNIRVIRERK